MRALVISHTYVPDPASVGQHTADAAEALAKRGWEVTALAARRGYDDPTQRYPARQQMRGVRVRRLPLSSFGKSTITVRALGWVLFTVQCLVRGVFMRKPDVILVSTFPPLAPLAAITVGALRRVPMVFWAMDINPDQALAMGEVSPSSLRARALEWLTRLTLKRASAVVALDRFMADRLLAKAAVTDKLHIIPPWPHEDHLQASARSENPFRAEHGLTDAFVLMYSGNHSVVHPLDTALEAAQKLSTDAGFRFLFVGGGLGKPAVDRFIADHDLPNVLTLPYQPIERLGDSLSAADVHLVSMGNTQVGIVHPCKAYGAMAVNRPLLLLGPADSHLGELIRTDDIGWQVDHGDVDGFIAALREAAAMSDDERNAMGVRARRAIDTRLSKPELTSQLIDVIEEAATGMATSGGPGGTT